MPRAPRLAPDQRRPRVRAPLRASKKRIANFDPGSPKGYNLTSTLGNMFENPIVLARIIASGLLDEHPKLKLVSPHLGGTLPYISGRMDHLTSTDNSEDPGWP